MRAFTGTIQEWPAMHDIKSIRDNPLAFDAGLKRRGLAPLSSTLLAIDERRRAAILASEQAQARRNAASKEIAEPVPLHLRNAPTRLMKELEYGKGYRYAHDEAEGVAADMVCLPPAHEGRQFYEPTDRGLEAEIRKKLEEIRRKRGEAP